MGSVWPASSGSEQEKSKSSKGDTMETLYNLSTPLIEHPEIFWYVFKGLLGLAFIALVVQFARFMNTTLRNQESTLKELRRPR